MPSSRHKPILFAITAIAAFALLQPRSVAAQAQLDSVRITFTQHTQMTITGDFTNCSSQYVGSHPDPVGNGRDSDYIYKFDTGSVFADGYDGRTPSTWTGDHLDIAGERITFLGGSRSASGPTWVTDGCGHIFDSHAAFWANLWAGREAWAHYVRPANKLPVASFTFVSGEEFFVASFDGSGSSDEDGQVVSYAWDFGDGKSGTGAGPSHTYEEGGTYTVTLVVTDDDGAQSAPFSRQVEVTEPPPNEPPVASFTHAPADKLLTVAFDARRLASGVYIYRLQAPGVRLSRQMTLLK